MQSVPAAIKKLPSVRHCRVGLGSEPALQKLSLDSLLQLLSRPSAPVASAAGGPPQNAACSKLTPAPSSGQRLRRHGPVRNQGLCLAPPLSRARLARRVLRPTAASQRDRAIFPAHMLFLTPAVGAGVVVRAAWLAPVGQALRTRRAGAFSLPSHRHWKAMAGISTLFAVKSVGNRQRSKAACFALALNNGVITV